MTQSKLSHCNIDDESGLEPVMHSLTGRKYIVPVKSGSAALICALKSANIAEGSDVVMPAICCPAVLFAIQMAGYNPVLADVSLDNLCMNLAQIETAITNNCKAIVAVHAYGHYCEISEIERFAKDKNLFLIEDACLTMGGNYRQRRLGSFGDASIFSFGYDKIVNCGKGGVLVTDSDDLFQNASQFINENAFFRFDMTDEEWCDLFQKFSNLEKTFEVRKRNARMCCEQLNGAIVRLLSNNDDVVYWRYPALYNANRNELIESARQKKIIITAHYKSLSHFITGCRLSNADYVSEHIINLFVRPETPTAQLQETIGFINSF